MTDSTFAPAVGTLLAEKYKVERVLGQGGMGLVVAAQHVLLDQRVAVKLMLPDAVRDPASVERFLREARAAGKLESEHVARILDVGKLDTGAPYIAMEFLEGDDLETVVERDGPMPIGVAVDCILQAIDAIGEAHSIGIVHRDLKPANLFRTQKKDGSASIKVLDFGISRNVADVKLTAPTALVGSPSYMAPEQVRAEANIDERSDIWALGVTLYEILTGHTPFPGAAASAVFVAILGGVYAPLRQRRPDAPEGLEAVIAKCLTQDPTARYRDVIELAHALVAFGGGAGVRAVERSSALYRAAMEGAPTQRPNQTNPTATKPQVETVISKPVGQTDGGWERLTADNRRRRTLIATVIGGALTALTGVGFWMASHTAGPGGANGSTMATGMSATSGTSQSIVAVPLPSAVATPLAATATTTSTTTTTTAPLATVAAAPPVASSAAPAHSTTPSGSRPHTSGGSTSGTAAAPHPSSTAPGSSSHPGSPDLDSRY